MQFFLINIELKIFRACFNERISSFVKILKVMNLLAKIWWLENLPMFYQ